MIDQSLLLRLAGTYIWWKTPSDAVAYPERLLAQVMDMGSWDDVEALEAAMGDDGLRAILRHSGAGWFSEKSWAYWHYRLGLASAERPPPPLVARKLA
ncbi:MAG: hypothetical protein KGQ37_11665 [Hyphomicrobiales bacterium]|nr:hypothetical protein [Hyphomicrobiales bacterium]